MIPIIMIATPMTFLREIFSFSMKYPIRKTQIKMVAVIQGMTDIGTWIRAIWLMASVRKRSP